jgi:hypothetical protein
MHDANPPGHPVMDAPQVTTAQRDIPAQIATEIDARVAKEFERRAQQLKDRLKYALLGFALFIVVLPLGGDDVIRSLHEKAFPAQALPPNSNVPLISFGSGIELRVGDPRAASSFMSFYAERGQRVHLYLTLTPRWVEADGEPPRIVVSVDGKPVGPPITSWVGGFKDISSTMAAESLDLGREQNVHQLGFALADFGTAGSGEVVISAIVLVF